jgi:peptide deformylase
MKRLVAMLNLRYYGDPILRKKADPVLKFDDSIRELVYSMIEIMREHDGLGLAAPQVGRSVRCVVIDPSKEGASPLILINPVYTFKSKETEVHEEGCLSFPDVHVDIIRPKVVSVQAFDENGREFAVDNAQDMMARALQHEIDHLDGLFIIDHISLLKRKLLANKLKKISELNFSETTCSDS